MDELHYLYGFTWAKCLRERFGPGVDPRFPVELLCCRQLGVLTSLVGEDQFDAARLEQEDPDPDWLVQVALRHNRVIQEVAGQSSVLPLRVGTIFRNRASLLHKVGLCESSALDFLRRLGGRQEWSVKVFLDCEQLGRQAAAPPLQTVCCGQSSGAVGMEYIAARRMLRDRERQVETILREDLQNMENALASAAEAWCRLRTLPSALAGRTEKMLWNAAFLVSSTIRPHFQAECQRLKYDLAPKGLILETNGPWPLYNFCPKLDL